MIRKPINDLSIKPKMSSTTTMSLAVGGMFVLFVCLYLAFDQGMKKGHSLYESDQAELNVLKAELTNVTRDLDKAEGSLIFAQRQKQIQEEAYKQLNKAYANSEQKNAVLGSRLDFYRSIISPEDGQGGPAIQDLKQTYVDGQLRFDVTLVQAIRHKQQVQGNLVVTLIEGDVPTARWPANSARSVNYQYFQQVSGLINKPILSDDAKIKVELQLQDGVKLERWFNVSLTDASAG